MAEPEDYEKADLCIYQQLIGKLIYLTYKTRPDITFIVGQLNRHNANPQKSHLQATKRLVRCFCGTIEMKLVYGRELSIRLPKNLPPYGLIGFADSNFAENPRDYKLVMGYCFFLNKVIVFWYSKKQRTVFTLTIEAEYIALGYVAKKAMWIRQFINEMKLEVVEDLMLYGNNKISIILTKNVKSQYKRKHIDVQHYYIREIVNEGKLTIK